MSLVQRMQKRISKPMLIFIGALLLLATLPLATAAAQAKPVIADDIKLKLDGKAVPLANPARTFNDRTYLPVAQLANLFGAQVVWDQDNEEATIETAYGDEIVLGNEVPVVYFNGGRYIMDSYPFLADGRMYIPLRYIAELLHATVSWNEETKTAELESVPLAVVTSEQSVTDISKEAGVSTATLMKRNGIDSAASVKEGTKLCVVIPTILSKPAKAYTDADYQLLAKITQVEAGNESYEAQLAVANVILNRVNDSRFPDSIHDVIYSGMQFPPAHNGLLDRSVAKSNALRAAKDALNGKNNVEGALYFYNPNVTGGSFWSSLTYITTVGTHRFVK